jgi:hypothetical protein
MALGIWDEWRLAMSTDDFRRWLAEGAPSDDREGAGERPTPIERRQHGRGDAPAAR